MKIIIGTSIRSLRAIALLFLLFIGASVEAGESVDTSIEVKLKRLTEFVVEVVPIGASMELIMGTSDYWPLRRLPQNPQDSLVCVRSMLTATEYKGYVYEQVARYVRTYPGRIDNDLRLLNSVGKKILKPLFVEDGTNVMPPSGFQFEEYAQRNKLSRKEKDVAKSLLLSPEYGPLRGLLGLRDKLSAKILVNASANKLDLIVDIRTDYLIRRVNQCGQHGSEFLMPSERFPSEPLTLIYQVTTKRRTLARQIVYDAKCNIQDKAREVGAPQPVVQVPRKDPLHPLTVPEFSGNEIESGQSITALVRIYVTELGQVERAEMDHSTGISEIDDIAIHAPRSWTFIPGMVDGEAACAWVTVPLRFSSKERNAIGKT